MTEESIENLKEAFLDLVEGVCGAKPSLEDVLYSTHLSEKRARQIIKLYKIIRKGSSV